MAGVEPASEEKTIRTDYMRSLSFTPRPCGFRQTGRLLNNLKEARLRRASHCPLEERRNAILPESSLCRETTGGIPESALRKGYLSSECVIVVST